MNQAPPVASSTTKLDPVGVGPTNCCSKATAPVANEGPTEELESNPPMSKKLSNTNSGNIPRKRGLMPEAFQPALKGLLYQPCGAVITKGFASSPEQADK